MGGKVIVNGEEIEVRGSLSVPVGPLGPNEVIFEVVQTDTEEVVHRIATTSAKADRVERGILRQLDAERFFVRRAEGS